MREEKSLRKRNDVFFSRIIQNIKIKLFRMKQKDNLILEENQNNKEINDFEILKSILNGQIKIKDIDLKTKQRLIDMCRNKLIEINKEISQIQEKNRRINVLINELKQI